MNISSQKINLFLFIKYKKTPYIKNKNNISCIKIHKVRENFTLKIWFYEKTAQLDDLLGIWDNVPTIPRIGEKVEILKTVRTVTDIKYVKNGNNFRVEIITN